MEGIISKDVSSLKASAETDPDAMFLYGAYSYLIERSVRPCVRFLEGASARGIRQADSVLRMVDSVPLTPSMEERFERIALESIGTDDVSRIREFVPDEDSSEEMLAGAFVSWCDSYGRPDDKTADIRLGRASELGDPMADFLIYRGIAPPDIPFLGAFYRPSLKQQTALRRSAENGYVPAIRHILDSVSYKDEKDRSALIEQGLRTGDVEFLFYDIDRRGPGADRQTVRDAADEGSGKCCYRYITMLMPNDESELEDDGERDEAVRYLEKGAALGDQDCMLRLAVAGHRGLLSDMEMCDVALWYVASYSERGSPFSFREALEFIVDIDKDVPDTLY